MLIMCKGKNFIYFSHLKQCKTIFKRKGKETSLFIGRHNNSPIRYLNREKQAFFISTYQPPVHRISTRDSHTYVSPVTAVQHIGTQTVVVTADVSHLKDRSFQMLRQDFCL